MGLWYHIHMNETSNNSDNEVLTPMAECAASVTQSNSKKRGRPMVNVKWPAEEFTFSSLVENNNVLSSSSLRKKMRAEIGKGGLMKTGTLKTVFGRPQNIYKKV